MHIYVYYVLYFTVDVVDFLRTILCGSILYARIILESR